MATSSRRLSQRMRTSKPSHTSGRSKGGNCVKSALKTFGATANPYKLKGAALARYARYCAHVNAIVYGKKEPTT